MFALVLISAVVLPPWPLDQSVQGRQTTDSSQAIEATERAWRILMPGATRESTS